MIRHNIVKTWRDSASLLIVAKNGHYSDGYKILMLKRSAKSKFMPNTYVYPGGIISSSDYSREWTDILKLKNCESYNRILNTEYPRPFTYCVTANTSENNALSPEVAFRLCALRETFEESGILLVRDNKKEFVLGDPGQNIGGKYSTLGRWRDKVNEDASNFLKLFKHTTFVPDILSLFEWSTWLTPTIRRQRFFTMFYICFVDNILNQSEDYIEIVDSNWLSPYIAVQSHYRNDLELPFPQLYESNRILLHSTFKKLNNFAEERQVNGLDLWCPFIIKLVDGFIIAYPGDDHHNDHPNEETGHMDLTIEELRSISTNVNRFEVISLDNIISLHCNVEWFGHLSSGNISSRTFLHEDKILQ